MDLILWIQERTQVWQIWLELQETALAVCNLLSVQFYIAEAMNIVCWFKGAVCADMIRFSWSALVCVATPSLLYLPSNI